MTTVNVGNATVVNPTTWSDWTQRGITRNGAVFTIAESGLYVIGYQVKYSANRMSATSRMFASIVVVSSGVVLRAYAQYGDANIFLGGVYGFNAGEQFKPELYQNGGATLTATGSFNCARVDDL